MSTKRLKPEARREDIIDAALTLSARDHYSRVTREMIAKRLSVSPATIQYHFGTMPALRRALVRAAVHGMASERRQTYRDRCAKLVAQAVLDGNRYTKDIPPEVRASAMKAAQEFY